MAESIGIRQADEKFVKSTIPGSSLHWRWGHPVNDPAPSDARLDISSFQTLVITEGGPPPRADFEPHVQSMGLTFDLLRRFAANAIENDNDGKGMRDIILWSIWPSHSM